MSLKTHLANHCHSSEVCPHGEDLGNASVQLFFSRARPGFYLLKLGELHVPKTDDFEMSVKM